MVFGYDSRSRLQRWWTGFRGRYWEEPEYQWRYCTEADALAGHAVILGAVKRGKLDQVVLAIPIDKQKVVEYGE